MKYLIYTPFRCGSSYLTRFVEKNIDQRASFFHNYKNHDSDNQVIKGHNEPIESDLKEIIDCAFTCIRKPTEIFLSAYIKDFKTEEQEYSYYYKNPLYIDNLNDIIDHFMSFEWDEFEWLSYDYNFIQLRKMTGINVWNDAFDKDKGYIVFNSKPKLIVLTHDILFNRFSNFQELCRDELKFSNLNKGVFSFRNSDTYGDFYKTFLDNIPEDFYKKYKYLDDRIVEKFL